MTDGVTPDLSTRRYAEPLTPRGRYLAFSPKLAAFLQASDAALRLLPKRRGALKPGGPWALLVSNLAHMGDLIVHVPLLRRLQASGQVSRLGVLTSPSGAAVLRLFLPQVALHVFDHWSLSRGGGGLGARLAADARARGPLIRALREARYDVALDAYPWFGNAALSLWGAGVPVRIGFGSGGGGPLYTHGEAESLRQDRSVAETSARLLAPLMAAGLALPEGPGPAADFVADPEAAAFAAQAGRYAVLHLGRGEAIQAWPLERWREAALGLKGQGYRLVFTGAAAEAAYGAGLRAELADHDLVGRGDLRFFATVLKEAALVVSVDTLTPHLAGLFETPTVVIPAGRQPLAWWRPPHAFARQIVTQTGCLPCLRKDGCEAMACLRETPAQALLNAAKELAALSGR